MNGTRLLAALLLTFGSVRPAAAPPIIGPEAPAHSVALVGDWQRNRRGAPVFGYRACRAADGNSLMIVSIDPVSTAILNTIVVYDRH